MKSVPTVFLRKSTVSCIVLCLFLLSPLFAQQKPETLTLFDFEDFDLSTVQANGVRVERVQEGGNQALKLISEPGLFRPGITLIGPEDGWDLNGYYEVKMDVTNLTDHFTQMIMRVGNPADGMEAWQMEIAFDLQPHESRTIADRITTTPWLFSEPLELLGMRAAPGHTKTDLSHIDRIILMVDQSSKSQSVRIDNIRATNPVRRVDPDGFLPFVDKFGQYRHADWPGKTRSVDDLQQQRMEEEARMAACPAPDEFDKWGGWENGPKFEATGFFRPQKYNGVWWLADPDGYLFWSHGVCCVDPWSVSTGITDREEYFEWLPDKESEFGFIWGEAFGAAHGYYVNRQRETFNFTVANLVRKYGSDWQKEFNRTAHARLRSWGMNTFGIATDEMLYREQKTPYTATVWVNGTKKIEASSGYWGKFHDVFDPGFRTAVREALATRRTEGNDPWCLGFFIENELSWGQDGSLALATLASPADQAAKIEFVNDLKKKYGDINKLNAVWGTTHASWDALLQSREKPDEKKAWKDLIAFYEKIAETYFSTVKEEMRAVAPHVMYLGCRLAWYNSDIITGAAAEYCDVLSYNKYEYSVADFSLPKGVDKPVIISEFHFGALDRGALHVGIRAARDQCERAELYTSYVEGALRNPCIIGTHWFQYYDQPPTGRFDGENYNVGLVDVCDRPFRVLTNAVKKVGYELYQYRTKEAQK